MPALLALTALAAIVAAAVWLRQLRRRDRARQQAIAALLDAADQLEARLRTAREEIVAIAGDHSDPVRDALQEMLRQRLWLQQHGDDATLSQLHAVRASILAARTRIDQQLLQVERARARLH